MDNSLLEYQVSYISSSIFASIMSRTQGKRRPKKLSSSDIKDPHDLAAAERRLWEIAADGPSVN